MLPRLIMMGSGLGTTIAFFCKAVKEGRLPAKIVSIVTDQKTSGVLRVAESFSIPSKVIAYKRGERNLG